MNKSYEKQIDNVAWIDNHGLKILYGNDAISIIREEISKIENALNDTSDGICGCCCECAIKAREEITNKKSARHKAELTKKTITKNVIG